LWPADWNASLVHSYREANRAADFLANLGHRAIFVVSVIDTFPPTLRLILSDDARGVVFKRSIAL